MDVRTDISTLDISDQAQMLPADLRHRARQLYGQPVVLSTIQNGICLSPMGLAILMGIGVLVVAGVVVFTSYTGKTKGALKK
uniref:Uncharacterized protein n=1 Tax=Parascaris equorum TaxID=6256 RepID=A0A914SA68_PAREQ